MNNKPFSRGPSTRTTSEKESRSVVNYSSSSSVTTRRDAPFQLWTLFTSDPCWQLFTAHLPDELSRRATKIKSTAKKLRYTCLSAEHRNFTTPPLTIIRNNSRPLAHESLAIIRNAETRRPILHGDELRVESEECVRCEDFAYTRILFIGWG